MRARSNVQNITVPDVHQLYLILGPQRVLWIVSPVFSIQLLTPSGDMLSSSYLALVQFREYFVANW